MTKNLQPKADSANAVSTRETGEEPIHRHDVHDRLTAVTDIFGRKWGLVIIYELIERGPMGFSGLQDQIDEISGKVLAQTLEDLMESGLVDRTIVSDRPIRVEYSVTERGRQLYPVIATVRHDFDWLSNTADGE